jgi:hypothetical protein
VDPVIIAIATAAAGKLAEATAGGIVAAGKHVREYFSKRSEQEVILMRAETGRGSVEDLATAIAKACSNDAALLQRLTQLTGQPITVSSVDQSQQEVQFQNNFYGNGPEKFYQAETMNFQDPR